MNLLSVIKAKFMRQRPSRRRGRPRLPRSSKRCEVCGVEFGHDLPPKQLAKRRVCSPTCWQKMHFRPSGPQFPERDKEIAALRRSGQTLEAVGARYGMTRERVRQIVEREGGAPEAHRIVFPHVRRRCATCGEEYGKPMLRSEHKERQYCSSPCRSAAQIGKRQKHTGRAAEIIEARLNGVSWKELRLRYKAQHSQLSVLVWEELYKRGQQHDAELTHRIWSGHHGRGIGGLAYRRAFLERRVWAREIDRKNGIDIFASRSDANAGKPAGGVVTSLGASGRTP